MAERRPQLLPVLRANGRRRYRTILTADGRTVFVMTRFVGVVKVLGLFHLWPKAN
jgi:hypothetical protein